MQAPRKLINRKMKWIFKKLGYRDREYRGSDFRVRIKPIMREAVSVIYTRDGSTLELSGERIGRRWEGVQVSIPCEVQQERASEVARDLETAFQALGYGYVIGRPGEVEIVSETERQAAIAELQEMGYEIEVSADRKQVRQKRREGAPRPDM